MRQGLTVVEDALGSPIRNLVGVVVFMVLVGTGATFAYMAAGWSFADASYMVVLTVFTVGYDEVRPIATPGLRLLTMGTIVFGCTGTILLTSTLVQIATVFQLRQVFGSKNMQNRIQALTGHAIICGYGRIGHMLARDLAEAGMPLIVLERSPAKLAEAEEAGHLCMTGDATAEEVLVAAGLTRARVLATVLPDDAANVFITLSARSLSPSIEIIARGEAPSTERKLRHAGADHVVLPTHIGAERIARMILFPHSTVLTDDARLDEIERHFGDLGLRLERVTATPGSAVRGLTVVDAERRAAGAFLIVQIEREGAGIQKPKAGERIAAGDRLLIVARGGIGAAHTLFSARAEIRVGRNVF